MLFPCIFLCCIRVNQLVIIIFHTFFTNDILILFPNLLSYTKQRNVLVEPVFQFSFPWKLWKTVGMIFLDFQGKN